MLTTAHAIRAPELPVGSVISSSAGMDDEGRSGTPIERGRVM
jgi:hypothetical protein